MDFYELDYDVMACGSFGERMEIHQNKKQGKEEREMKITKKQILEWSKDERYLDLGLNIGTSEVWLGYGIGGVEGFWKILDASQKGRAIKNPDDYLECVQGLVDIKISFHPNLEEVVPDPLH